MAEYDLPFTGDFVDAAAWQMLARHFSPTGVIPGRLNSLTVTAAGVAMEVTVATGSAVIEGFGYENDAPKTVTIEPAHATLPRIDRIVVRLDRAAGTLRAVPVKGTPADPPSAPALTQTDTIYEIPLANVTVSAGVGIIEAEYVADARSLARYDHGDLGGLGDDDHPQYYNTTRGDARWLGKTATAADSSKLSGYSQSINATTDSIARRTTDGKLAVGDPSGAGHAATKGYVDTGFLGLTAQAADSAKLQGYGSSPNATADTIARRAGSGVLAVGTPTSTGHAATKGYVDGKIVSGTYTGDGTAGRTITTGTSPVMLQISSVGGAPGITSFAAPNASVGGTQSGLYTLHDNSITGAATSVDGTRPLVTASGFEVSGSLNQSGIVYRYAGLTA